MVKIETSVGYDDRKIMWVSTDERRMITRMLKLAEQYPEEVQILAMPETNDGCLYMKCPASWLYIRHPKKMNITDEQKAAAAERLRKAREAKRTEQTDDLDDEYMEDDSEDA